MPYMQLFFVADEAMNDIDCDHDLVEALLEAFESQSETTDTIPHIYETTSRFDILDET